MVLLAVIGLPLRAQDVTFVDTLGTSVNGCATVYGRRVALDTIAFEVRNEAGCGPLTLELMSPARVALARLRAGDMNESISIRVRAANPTDDLLRAPQYLYTRDHVVAKFGGRSLPADLTRTYVTLESSYRDVWAQERGDLSPPPSLDGHMLRQRMLPGASSAEIDSIAPGGKTGEAALVFNLNADVEDFQLPLLIRALRASPLLPAAPPATMPAGVPAAARVITSDSVPAPFYRDLIRVRFRPDVALPVRQRLIDRTGGRVVGGLAAGDGKLDYVVQGPDSPDGRWVFAAFRMLPAPGLLVARRGVVLAAPLADGREVHLPDSTPADPMYITGVFLRFSFDATEVEKRSVLAAVGGRVLAYHGASAWAEVVVLDADSSAAGLARLARRFSVLSPVARADAHSAYRPVLSNTPRDSLETPWTSAPAPDSGQSAGDPAVRRFVADLTLPTVHSIRDFVYLPEVDLLFFSVAYGAPLEVYAGVMGVRHGRRLGLLLRPDERPWQAMDTLRNWPRFTLRPDDMVLADPAVLDSTERLNLSLLPLLLQDSLVTRDVIRRCTVQLYHRAGRCQGPDIAAAATRIGDVAGLTQLSFAPNRFHGQGATIEAAQTGLRQLASTALSKPRLSRAILLALAGAAAAGHPFDSLLALRILNRREARQDAAIIALLAANRPWVQERLLQLLPARADMRRTIASIFSDERGTRPEIMRMLDDPVIGKDLSFLRAIAHLPLWSFPAARAEAARRLPEGDLRLGGSLEDPPPVTH